MKNTKNQILYYHAIFQPAPEGGYDVSFPSLPGCVTFGKNFEEAKEKAQEILELWLEELVAQGEPIPAYRKHPIVDELEVTAPAKAKLFYAIN